MILILGGTHEGAILCKRLDDAGIAYHLSVATELGRSVYGDLKGIVTQQRFTDEGLADYIKANQIEMVLDLTHPHAKVVTEMARRVCASLDTNYLRYERPMNTSVDALPENVWVVSSVEAAIQQILRSESGSILMTGTKHIADFIKVFGKAPCYFRVMPSVYSMTVCDQESVDLDHIFGIKAPCPVAVTRELIASYGIKYFVFKESGIGSATESNIEAVKGSDVIGILIRSDEAVAVNTAQSETEISIPSLELAPKKTQRDVQSDLEPIFQAVISR